MTISIKKLKEVSLQTESKKHRALVNLGRGSPGIPGFVLKSADKLQASIEVFYLFIANGF